jgi:hypothetical protein
MNAPRDKTEGEKFLQRLSNPEHTSFDHRFAAICYGLDLGALLSTADLILLHDAALFALLCNISFNGLGGSGGAITPDPELHRIELERKYMDARRQFLDSEGWQFLPESKQGAIKEIFLNAFVADYNLASDTPPLN